VGTIKSYGTAVALSAPTPALSGLATRGEECAAMSDGEAGSAAEQVTPSGSLTDLAEEYRRTRAEVESSILPLATSVDGRQFTFQVSLHGLTLQTGGYVVLERDEERRFGQILSMRPDAESAPDLGLDTMRSSMLIRFARGEGVILEGDLQPFHDAVVRRAASGEVDLTRTTEPLGIDHW
jgi:hypothetical protein